MLHRLLLFLTYFTAYVSSKWSNKQGQRPRRAQSLISIAFYVTRPQNVSHVTLLLWTLLNQGRNAIRKERNIMNKNDEET